MAIAAEPPLLLDDLSDDHIELICLAAANDFCGGATVIAQLAACSRRLCSVISDPARIARFAAVYEILSLPTQAPLRLEHLGVLETVAGLGTNRIYFGQRGRLYQKYRLPLRPGSSEPRLREFVKMMEAHPRTTVFIEGHASSQERDVRDSNGRPVNISQDRADTVCCLMADEQWTREHGSTCRIPFSRMRRRDWTDRVVVAAGWGSGTLGSHLVELFFTLDGVEIPTRSEHYARIDPAPPAAQLSIPPPSHRPPPSARV